MTSPFRPNPAKDDYQLRKLFDRVAATYHQVSRVAADSHQPSTGGGGGGGGTPPTSDSVTNNPAIGGTYKYTSPRFTGTETTLVIPVSTIAIPHPTIAGAILFPGAG